MPSWTRALARLSAVGACALIVQACDRPPTPAAPAPPVPYPPGGYGQPGYPPGPGYPGVLESPAPPDNPGVAPSTPPPPPLSAPKPGAVSPGMPAPVPTASPHGPIPEGFRMPMPKQQLGPDAPAMRYANLRPSACRQAVQQRGLPVRFEAKAVRHVATATRLTGSLRGVRFVTARAPSPFGILDCRLALALDDMAGVMARFGVTEVHIGSMHRPSAVIRGTRQRSQHAHGLAVDISAVRRHDDRLVKVEGHWGADIGDQACGPGAPMKSGDADALFMRDMVCAIARENVFHHMLTPSANADHLNHFHFDIQRDRRNGWLR